jgi:hypothetical protein
MFIAKLLDVAVEPGDVVPDIRQQRGASSPSDQSYSMFTTMMDIVQRDSLVEALGLAGFIAA